MTHIVDLPHISFIIPAYNAQKTIAACLTSLISCDYPAEKKEIIVINNNSHDRTVEIAKNFPAKIFDELKQGRSIARNRGAKEAQGEILVFVDADCRIKKNWLHKIIEKFKSEEIGAVQGPVIPIPDQDKNLLSQFRLYQAHKRTKGSYILLEVLSIKMPMINSATCAYRAKAFHLVNGFDESLERYEDIDLSRRVFNAGFFIASCSKAISEVYWHGEGWKDYILRAMDCGKFLVDYEKKWNDGIYPLKVSFQGLLITLRNFIKFKYKFNFHFSLLELILFNILNVFFNLITYSYYLMHWNFRDHSKIVQQQKNLVTFKKNFVISRQHLPSSINSNREIEFTFSRNFNFILITNKIIIKNIETNLVMEIDSIYASFLNELLQKSGSTNALAEKCSQPFDLSWEKINQHLRDFFEILDKNGVIKRSAQ